MNEYLTEREFAAESGLAVKTLQKWRWLNTGPPWVSFGSAVRYKRSELDAWLAARTVTPAE